MFCPREDGKLILVPFSPSFNPFLVSILKAEAAEGISKAVDDCC